VGNLYQVVFLTALFAGDILLVASFVVARFNWRPDVPPYNLRTRVLDVSLHPARYVLPRVLVLFRCLTVLGWLLLMTAVLTIARVAMLQLH